MKYLLPFIGFLSLSFNLKAQGMTLYESVKYRKLMIEVISDDSIKIYAEYRQEGCSCGVVSAILHQNLKGNYVSIDNSISLVYTQNSIIISNKLSSECCQFCEGSYQVYINNRWD